jgi:hypothetical protein
MKDMAMAMFMITPITPLKQPDIKVKYRLPIYPFFLKK